MERTSEAETRRVNSKTGGNDAQRTQAGSRAVHGGTNKSYSTSAHTELSAVLSASLATELLREIEELNSADDAAVWAQRRLAAKNQLLADDARQVEEAFTAKLVDDPSVGTGHQSLPEKKRTRIDKGASILPEPRRLRDRDHIRHVIKQPCLICGRRPSDPHHLRFAQCRALGRKVSDEFTVPLCRTHHREIHRCSDEASWWRKNVIDPLVAARRLWLETHPLPKGKTENEPAPNVAHKAQFD